jgi:hypothetical protein
MNPSNAMKSIGSRAINLVSSTPWLCDNIFGGARKLIFKSKEELIVSEDGNATIGTWTFLADANSFLLSMGNNSILLNTLYVDSNLMILHKDGSIGQCLLFRNANTFVFDSISQYFTGYRSESKGLCVVPLLSSYLLIFGDEKYLADLIGHNAIVLDQKCDSRKDCGTFISVDNKTSYTLDKGVFHGMANIAVLNFKGLGNVEIGLKHQDDNGSFTKTITHNGNKVPDGIYYDDNHRRFSIAEGEIQRMEYQTTKILSNGIQIKLLQVCSWKLSSGDIVLSPHIADGRYRLKGKMKRFKIIKNRII